MKLITVSFPFVLLLAALSGCTAVSVRPVEPAAQLKHVCIENNPKVTVPGFLDVIKEGFERHGISTETYSAATPENCEYTLNYTARRSWDFVPYLSVAELDLRKNGTEIASADYHLRMKGGLSLMKWKGTKSKMDPVIDELLKEYNK